MIIHFQGFQGQAVVIQGFQGFQGFQGPADTLFVLIFVIAAVDSVLRSIFVCELCFCL